MAGLQACREKRARHEAAARAPSNARLFRRGSAHAARSATVRSAAFWLCLALALAVALTGVGYAIAIALESTLLGFLGADLVFLIAISLYTSGPDRDRR